MRLVQKIEANRERDARKERELAALGWRVLTVYECVLRDKARLPESFDPSAWMQPPKR
jgi:DNA mismatch endonuclease (patch repair protein)